MKKNITFLLCTIIIIFISGGYLAMANDEVELQSFIDNHVKLIAPLQKQAALAYYDATQFGKSEDYDRYADLSLAISLIYSNSEDFKKLQNFKSRNKIRDPLLKRQLDLLYNGYLGNQLDSSILEEMTKKSTEVEELFNTFSYSIDGRSVNNNEINKILKEERDPLILEKAWKAQKRVGKAVADKLVELIKIRNKAAQSLGFKNYYIMSLTLSEQNPDWVAYLFDNLYKMTEESYNNAKSEIDSNLRNIYGVKDKNLAPWFYQDPFFQSAPDIYECNREKYIENESVLELTKYFYSSLGLYTADILAKSEPLYPQPGKNPHAYTINIDNNGDVRVFLNLENDIYWLETSLHELGHALYYKYQDFDKLPYLLRGVPHIFVTEAVAMFFERQPKKAIWWKDVLNIDEEEYDKLDNCLKNMLSIDQLVFARWDMVMTEFERKLYENPDQDLNNLWWQIVEKYQHVKKTENWNNPDWAAKIHFTSSPCYYHNYLLGELLASQVGYFSKVKILNKTPDEDVSYFGQIDFGNWIKNDYFNLGGMYRWDEFIKRVTGEELNPKYFVDDFVGVR
jgi:peptidyl-dipeptidase A